MSLWHPLYSLALSRLNVDVDKDWAKKNIINFGPGGIDLYSTLMGHASRHKPGGSDAMFPADYSILPSADNTYDLGSSTYRWRNAYFSGSLTIAGGITASGTANVGSLQIGGTTVIDSSRNLLNVVTETLVGQTANPTLAAGRIWFRSDLRQILWSPDGTAVKQVYPADWGDITNKPSTFPPSAHASTHKPGGSDAMFPADYSISPAADNAYDLGSSTYRWRNAYFSGSLTVAGAANVGSLQIGGTTVIDSSRNVSAVSLLVGGVTVIDSNRNLTNIVSATVSGVANVGSLQIGGTTVIDSSRNLQNANWISGVMRRDAGQEIFRCQNDTAQTFTFALRNAANTGAINHRFVPSDDTYGYFGYVANRWLSLYSVVVNSWQICFRGAGPSYVPYDVGVDHSLIPGADGCSYVGTDNLRFKYIRGLSVVSGDLGFEDDKCLVCGKKFREGDAVVLKVRKLDPEHRQILCVPVHSECNPHPLDPELMKEHEKMLLPNRGEGECFRPNPPKEGEFEVVSVTVEDENVMTVNCICGDGTSLSFPAPVDADEETITRLASEYYELVKREEAEREARRERGRAKLRRDWRGFKAKLGAGPAPKPALG